MLPMCPGRTVKIMERAKGFEPSTPTLATLWAAIAANSIAYLNY